jgi:hypothetical protein
MTAVMQDKVKIFRNPVSGLTLKGDRWVILYKVNKDNYMVIESWRSKEPAKKALNSLRDTASKYAKHGIEHVYILVDTSVVPVIL